MAVINGLPGVKVEIHVDGKATKEYPLPRGRRKKHKDDSSLTTTNYIQSSDHTTFTINITINNHYFLRSPVEPHTLNLAAYIDGQWVGGELCRPDAVADGPWEKAITSRVVSAGRGNFKRQGFKFAKLKIVSGENEQSNFFELDAKNTGMIVLAVNRCVLVGSSPWVPEKVREQRSLQLPEEELKGRAVSHSTLFDIGKEFSDNNLPNMKIPQYADSPRLEGDEGAFAVFRFYYQSQEALLQEGIIETIDAEMEQSHADNEEDEVEIISDSMRQISQRDAGHRNHISQRDKTTRKGKPTRKPEVIVLSDSNNDDGIGRTATARAEPRNPVPEETKARKRVRVEDEDEAEETGPNSNTVKRIHRREVINLVESSNDNKSAPSASTGAASQPPKIYRTERDKKRSRKYDCSIVY